MRDFLKSDTGAVTVDWVVLTAALVGLGLAAMGVVSSGVEDTSGDIESKLTSNIIASSFSGSPQHTIDTYDFAGCPSGLAGAVDYAMAHDAQGWEPVLWAAPTDGEGYVNGKYTDFMNNYSDAYITYNRDSLRTARDTGGDIWDQEWAQVNLAVLECAAAAKGL